MCICMCLMNTVTHGTYIIHTIIYDTKACYNYTYIDNLLVKLVKLALSDTVWSPVVTLHV